MLILATQRHERNDFERISHSQWVLFLFGKIWMFLLVRFGFFFFNFIVWDLLRPEQLYWTTLKNIYEPRSSTQDEYWAQEGSVALYPNAYEILPGYSYQTQLLQIQCSANLVSNNYSVSFVVGGGCKALITETKIEERTLRNQECDFLSYFSCFFLRLKLGKKNKPCMFFLSRVGIHCSLFIILYYFTTHRDF